MNANMFDSHTYIRLHKITDKRYHEIRWWCLGYDNLKEEYEHLHSMSSTSLIGSVHTNKKIYYDGVENAAIEAVLLKDEIDILPAAAHEVDPGIESFLMLAATRNIPYDRLKKVYGLQCTELYFDRCFRMFVCVIDRLLREKNIKLSTK